jgi:quercetin dioxygenase-like cupin family protein
MSSHTTTPTISAAAIDELPSLFDGVIKLARSGLGIRAFGVQVIDLPPGHVTDAHDERPTGQEELYAVLDGDGAVVLDDDSRYPLDSGHLVRVAPERSRRLAAGPGGARVMVVGGVPGAPYEAPDWTEA